MNMVRGGSSPGRRPAPSRNGHRKARRSKPVSPRKSGHRDCVRMCRAQNVHCSPRRGAAGNALQHGGAGRRRSRERDTRSRCQARRAVRPVARHGGGKSRHWRGTPVESRRRSLAGGEGPISCCRPPPQLACDRAASFVECLDEFVVLHIFVKSPTTRAAGLLHPGLACGCRGENSSSSTSNSSSEVRVCLGGEKNRCATKVGIIADRITAVTSTEN